MMMHILNELHTTTMAQESTSDLVAPLLSLAIFALTLLLLIVVQCLERRSE
jgi:hypothetical protein